MWTPNDIQTLHNEQRSNDDRPLHLEGNFNSSGVNVHSARYIITNDNQTDKRYTLKSLCGLGWDIKHKMLVILVISTIIVMITTFSVVLSKCSQVRITH